ncbi:SDR family oxidoreductase [Pseudoroseomonas cervicalis]|uniref:SDR family NAD(P)-dependent oxidoreductase n=1 Tax=Teichococcus cervicalis TaxID=204525 RepID=UPI0022F1A7FA|nr:SDR family oxidoreductase [Pseudoroseomonas cervicalis]WBV45470.1 SDR family oxidoreductase [Pseudoroseomonas cervicalis]
MPSPSNIALITGASSGIGAVYAERLARRGHDLLLVARGAERLEALAGRLRRETGRQVETWPADLQDPAAVEALALRLSEDAGIAMLVNNAGIAQAGGVLRTDPARLGAMLQLNVQAAARLAQAAAAAFHARGAGTLVNIASVLGLAPERFNAVYAASKAFVLVLSQGLAAELQGSGVRVQAVLPGATRTPLWDSAGVDPASLPPEMLMAPEAMVDAALAGLDAGELVTIPSLPDMADWQALETARLALGPNLSRDIPAPRYRGAADAA